MVQVLSLAVFALLLARIMRAPRGTWRYIIFAAVLALLASQMLPAGNPYRSDVAAGSRLLFWTGLALVPVAAYALVLRRVRARTGADRRDAPPGHPAGLVQIAEDARLVDETRAAIEAETPEALGGVRLSLGWRATDGALAGHLLLRFLGEVAEIEQLRVDPAHRGLGIGTALLRAAEGEAGGRAARRIAVRVGGWQNPGFFARAGYRTVSSEALGGGHHLEWMERELS